MAYGGPESLEDVEPYLLDLRGHRETPAALVAEVRCRYERIGGGSPILERTRAQADALGRAFAADDGRFEVAVGMRHWRPYIAAALTQLAERGVGRAVGLVMAPHASRMSVAAYYKKVADARSPVGVAPIESWHLLPGYVRAVAECVRLGLERFPAAVRSAVPVIFTAHSLPERSVTWDDPYPRQLGETVEAVMRLLGDRPHRFAYQSASMTEEPWLGPDVADVVDELAAGRLRHVLVAPIGFVSENVEILYDLDIALRERARRRGVWLERTAMPNDDGAMIADLAALVRSRAREAGWL
jgi:ferrochelatase